MEAIEICAGAGGQSLGLHLAGFTHRLAVELDSTAARTLAENLARRHGLPVDGVLGSIVRVGDVASKDVWDPAEFDGVDLIAGGVPCPPFTVAGKQRGAEDVRDLFAWAIELTARVRPKALLLENVRGLSQGRFSGYRQAVADRLEELGYWSEWKMLHASDFGVPQVRPRFVLVALNQEYAPYFAWPEPRPTEHTVGSLLLDLMSEGGWAGAKAWAAKANGIAPTIVGGSKHHGGADLGPSGAKAAWRRLGVDAHGVADGPPQRSHAFDHLPRLTCAMVERVQGWYGAEYEWSFTGRKTAHYRQIGNAFPPPMARAVGTSIADALRKDVRHANGTADGAPERTVHDHVYRLLRDTERHLTVADLAELLGRDFDLKSIRRKVDALRADFVLETELANGAEAYRIVQFKAFTGQDDHARHESFELQRARIS